MLNYTGLFHLLRSMKIFARVLFILFFPLNLIAQTKSIDQVKAALDGHVNAWNSGRIEDAIAYFYNSDSLLWVNRAGIEKGYQPILGSYLQDFADRSKMGTYSYEPLYIELLSSKSVYYVYRWKIELNGKKLRGGVSSQIWKKSNKRWLVFIEHFS